MNVAERGPLSLSAKAAVDREKDMVLRQPLTEALHGLRTVLAAANADDAAQPARVVGADRQATLPQAGQPLGERHRVVLDVPGSEPEQRIPPAAMRASSPRMTQ